MTKTNIRNCVGVLLFLLSMCGCKGELKFPNPPQNDTNLAEIKPTYNPLPTPTDEPTATPKPMLCSDISRPAMLVTPLNEKNEHINYVVDFQSLPKLNLTCAVSLDPSPERSVYWMYSHVINDNIFYFSRNENEYLQVWQKNPNTEAIPLSFTTASDTLLTVGSLTSDIQFSISPDGTKIAWTKLVENQADEEGNYHSEIWTADINGENENLLFIGDGIFQPFSSLHLLGFSPDGQRLLFSKGTSPSWHTPRGAGRYSNIWAISDVGGEPKLIFDCAEFDTAFCIHDFSDDGNFILYTDNAFGESLYIANIPDETVTSILTEDIATAFFGILDDAGAIAFLGNDGKSPALYTVTPPNGDPIRHEDSIPKGSKGVIPLEWINDKMFVFYNIDGDKTVGGSGYLTTDGEMHMFSPEVNFELLISQ